jgi:hypothetical protein
MGFDTYFWSEAEFADPTLSQAKGELADPTSAAAAARTFGQLITADSTAANGVAFDHYAYAEASGRFGVDNPFRMYADQVRSRAREALVAPPVARGVEGAAIDGANHASAAAALMNLAEPADQPLLAAAFASAANSDVRVSVLDAAETAVEAGGRVDDRLTAALALAVKDQTLPLGDREAALRVLNVAEPDRAVALAGELLDHAPLPLQTRAAWVLAERALEPNRDRLAELVARWPDSAPYPAFEVRQALALED